MIECVALMVMYAVLIFVALFSIYYIFQAVMEMLRDLLEELHDERITGNEEEKQKHDGSGQDEGRTELSGSNGSDAEEEEGSEWQKKKS